MLCFVQNNLNYNNLEEVYAIFYGASNSNGIKYDVLKRWFFECGLINNYNGSITEAFFEKSYKRLCPKREEVSLTQFVQLLGIFLRELRQDVEYFEGKFDTVKQAVLDEIQQRLRNEN